MSGIKTGTPGFVNPVDGKVYTLNPGGADSPPEVSANPVSDTPDPGDMTVDNTVKDISKKTRITLGTYLSQATKGKVSPYVGVPNKYSIDPPTEATPPLSLSENGYPVPPSPTINSEKFASNLPSSISQDYAEAISVSAGVTTLISKGRGVDTATKKLLDGNDLFKAITVNAQKVVKLPGPLENYSKAALTPNYRTSFVSFADFKDPPRTFNVPLANIPNQYFKNPGDESVDSGLLTLDLDVLRKKASEETSQNQFSISSPTGGPFDFLSPITDPVTNVPTPLGTFINKDSFVNRSQIKPLSSDPSITNFSRGKESNETNGNSLLLSVKGNRDVVKDGAKTLGGLPVGSSQSGIDESNPLYDYVGTRGAPVLSVGQNRWTAGVSNEIKLVLKDGTEVDQMKMATVGIGLMQRAAFQIPAGTADKFNPVGTEASLGGALLPPLSLVSKVDLAKLEAQDVFNRLSDDALFNPDGLTSIAQFDGQSWGTLYTADQQFEDFTNVGMLLVSYALITAVGVLLAGEGIRQKSPKRSLSGQLVKGKHSFTDQNTNTPDGNLFFKILGLKPTENDWSESLAIGFNSYFFGVDKAKENIGIGDGANRAGNLLQNVGAGLISGVNFVTGDSSSQNLNISTCRTIYRSFLVIGQKFGSLGNTFQSNPITGFASSFDNIIKIFRTSKLINAINVFSSLGDTVLNLLRGNEITQPDGTTYYSKEGFENVENIYNVVKQNNTEKNQIISKQQTVTKSRLTYGNTYDPSLAWGSARAPALYLTDTKIDTLSILDGEGKLNSFKGRLGLSSATGVGNKHPAFFAGASNGRISNAEREKMEQILDGEYVPFSFHDVRTNEVVSFHAFLTSMTDDYTASYDTTEGFGRVEPVKTYKGTLRKIGLSFYVAATSEQDFDHMWYKINKLTTLVYPQYTAGRDLLPDQFQFKAPFSQLPAASPLIRIRLGDLLRSNYSRFALARLFGAGDGDMKIPSTDQRKVSASQQNFTAQQESAYNGVINDYNTTAKRDLIGKEIAVNNNLQYLKNIGVLRNDVSTIKSIKVFDIRPNTTKNVFKTGQLDNDRYELSVEFETGSDRQRKTSTINYLEEISFVVQDPEIKKYIESRALEAKSRVVKQEATATNGDSEFYDSLNEFMNPQKNAIVKSFESAAGRGLAGVIESMNFDWYDKVTWSIDQGRTAPKLCKVTLNFSPIHDISPGLDHLGYNRAPIYPVGGGSAPSSFKK